MSRQLGETNGKMNFKEKKSSDLKTEIKRLRNDVEKSLNFFEKFLKESKF